MKKTKKINEIKIEKKNVSNFSKLIKNKKFKWILLASVAFVLCIATVLSIVLISNSMSPLEKFVSKIAKKQNFQMQVSAYGIPLLTSLDFVIEMDGNVTHIPDIYYIIEESYIEKVGDETFKYTKDENGKWVKTQEEDNDNDDATLNLLGENDLKELINPNNYELVEGKENVYRQKANVQFEKFKDITITLEDDSCKIEMITYIEEITVLGFTLTDIALETQIVISKIGQVDITLPKVA